MLTVYGDLNLKQLRLRSKRFQSSYCAKVRVEAKKKVEGGGDKRFLLSPPPPLSFIFFCSCSSFLDEPCEETLDTQARSNYSPPHLHLS